MRLIYKKTNSEAEFTSMSQLLKELLRYSCYLDLETGEETETHSLDYTQLFTVLEDILKRLDSLEQWRIESITGADLELEQCCAQISQCHLIPSVDREKIATYLHETRRSPH